MGIRLGHHGGERGRAWRLSKTQIRVPLCLSCTSQECLLVSVGGRHTRRRPGFAVGNIWTRVSRCQEWGAAHGCSPASVAELGRGSWALSVVSSGGPVRWPHGGVPSGGVLSGGPVRGPPQAVAQPPPASCQSWDSAQGLTKARTVVLTPSCSLPLMPAPAVLWRLQMGKGGEKHSRAEAPSEDSRRPSW